jgi:hypothetical protein
MDTIYFCNIEPIDLSAIAVMGVSVKTNNAPIGYFGTGLKFSIATLLRLGHCVALVRLGETIVFTTVDETIRGEVFQRVKMGDQVLGFTTQLGKNWEPWQAYRELTCNCMDEAGVVSDTLPDGDWGTVFIVEGAAVAECHRNRREIFLSTVARSATEECAIHDGATTKAFYRGVRAHDHGRPALFTYNILDSTTLTEDRTIKNQWEVNYYAERSIAAADDEDLIESALMAEKGTFENGLSYAAIGEKPSDAFMSTAFMLRHDFHCNQNAIKLWEKWSRSSMVYEAAALDDFDEAQIEAGLVLVRRLGAEVARRDFMVVDGLGESVFGRMLGGRIYISRAALDLGPRFVGSTIYEEWLHKTIGVVDETRAMQNLLFEKLMAMTERVIAMEKAR